jgi:hypothetical protein
MLKKYLFTTIFILTCYIAFAQQLPLGTCGIVCTYDVTGNRLRRIYFCNNGIDPYPVRPRPEEVKTTEEFISVDALYPNPTTGKFVVTFSKELKNASVTLTDVNGKIIQQFKGQGYRLSFDLNGLANGVYVVRVENDGLVITKKVVKQ